MRGEERRQRPTLVVVNAERRIPEDHPLRRIKQLAEAVLKELSPLFDQRYSVVGRPVDSARSAAEGLAADGTVHGAQRALFCEQLDYNLLFRWFLDLELDEASFDHSTFSRNRARLSQHEVAGEFFQEFGEMARHRRLRRFSGAPKIALVVETANDEKDFVENAWIGQTLTIGDAVRLSVTGPCPRSVMTTLPQGDLPKDAGILRAAAQHNRANVGSMPPCCRAARSVAVILSGWSGLSLPDVSRRLTDR